MTSTAGATLLNHGDGSQDVTLTYEQQCRLQSSLGRPRRRWEDNIKMDLREAGGGWRLDGVGSG